MPNLIIFGTSKFAQLAHFYFIKDSSYAITCFTEDQPQESHFCGLPVIPFDEIERYAPPSSFEMFVAIGYSKLNSIRESKYLEAKEKGYKFAKYLSSKATHWGDTQIGENSFILEDNNLQPFMQIGVGTVIWSGCHFGHDVEIGNFCFFSSHVVVCGDVKIGNNCFIGGNSFIRNALKIGNECIIGSQTVILNDTTDKQVFVTEPTKPFRLDSEQFSRFMKL